MTRCDAGNVVLVRFPFTSLDTSKRRPALVLSSRAYSKRYGDIVVLALTSRDPGDEKLALRNWQRAGLPKPTWCKPLIATIASGIVQNRIGTLASDDLMPVRQAIRRLISAEFLADSAFLASDPHQGG